MIRAAFVSLGCLLFASAAYAAETPQTPAAAPPMPTVTRFAEIKDGEGQWVVMEQPAMGMPMRQCTAYFETSGAAPAAMPTLTVNFMDQRGPDSERLQISLMANETLKPASRGVFAGETEIAGLTVNGSTMRNAMIEVTDIKGFAKKIHGSKEITLKLEDQKWVISTAAAEQLVEKLSSCVEKAVTKNPLPEVKAPTAMAPATSSPADRKPEATPANGEKKAEKKLFGLF